jgi:hypothetical protein
MKFVAAAALALITPPLAADAAAPAKNPLIGSWQLEQYVDSAEDGPPVYAFGEAPVGLFVFTADGHVSISIMRNPPAVGKGSSDPDPDACIPAWYCSYFGTYRYDRAGPSWTTHVMGGNIPNYLGTDQRRTFKIIGDLLTIAETYSADGKTFHAKRVLRRIRP